MDEKRRWLDVGWMLGGLSILFVGSYYLLRETFGIGLPGLNWDAVWPLAVIALGVGIVWRTWFMYTRARSPRCDRPNARPTVRN